MPIPQPRKGESQSDFMGRCMHEQKDTDKPQAQKVAICLNTWREAKGEKKTLDGTVLYRSANIVSGSIDKKARRVSFSVSSRYPVQRMLWDKRFKEVLSHDIGAIDTGRLDRGIVPLLWNHNWDNQIGILRQYSFQDGRLLATAEMSPNENGEDALRDMDAGIKTSISVGYIPRQIRCLRKRGQIGVDDENPKRLDPDDGFGDPDNDDDPDDSADDDDNGDDDDLYEVSRWEPIEVSLVSVPADPTVGIGRGFSESYEVRMIELDEPVVSREVNLHGERTSMPDAVITTTTGTREPQNVGVNPASNVTVNPQFTPSQQPAPVVELTREERSRVQDAELLRMREIQDYGARFECADATVEFIRSGKTVAEFQKYILDNRAPRTSPVTTVQDPNLGFSARDRARYSITRAVRNKLRAQSGEGRFDGFEAEVSREIALMHRSDPVGFYMPDWALAGDTRDLTVTPPPGGGNAGLTVQTTVEPSLIPLLRNRTAVLQAGARYMSGLQGNLLMPRQNAASTISWNTEIAPVTESDLTLDSVTLSPNRVGGWCTYSKQLIAQSSLDIDNIVRDDMIAVIQIAIDHVALSGTGTNQPVGILNVAANTALPYDYSKTAIAIAFPTGMPTWKEVVEFESNLESGNLVLDSSACYITSPSVKGAWKTYAKNDPRNTAGPFYPMFFWEGGTDGTVNGYRAIATNQVPGNKVIFGKWNELMIGQWAGLDIVVDIYTGATQAEIKIITNMFVDVKYRYASAFSYSTNSGVSN